MKHKPVLLKEVVELLDIKSGDNIVDCTVGDGGHAQAMLQASAPNGILLGIDADPESILRAKRFLYQYKDRVVLVRDNFVNLNEIIENTGFQPVHGILMDLGWSSPQFAERGRGFSFKKDEPLDMRYCANGAFDKSPTVTEIINQESEEELEQILRVYGEEKLSTEIAKAITRERKNKPISRTGDLARIILQVYRNKLKINKDVPWVGKIHPATRTFQALRIAVNNELEILERALVQARMLLEPEARLAVISFHSLEDRIVKHFFKASVDDLKIITKKPVTASLSEIKQNPRARSAKLRVAEKKE